MKFKPTVWRTISKGIPEDLSNMKVLVARQGKSFPKIRLDEILLSARNDRNGQLPDILKDIIQDLEALERGQETRNGDMFGTVPPPHPPPPISVKSIPRLPTPTQPAEPKALIGKKISLTLEEDLEETDQLGGISGQARPRKRKSKDTTWCVQI